MSLVGAWWTAPSDTPSPTCVNCGGGAGQTIADIRGLSTAGGTDACRSDTPAPATVPGVRGKWLSIKAEPPLRRDYPSKRRRVYESLGSGLPESPHADSSTLRDISLPKEPASISIRLTRKARRGLAGYVADVYAHEVPGEVRERPDDAACCECSG